MIGVWGRPISVALVKQPICSSQMTCPGLVEEKGAFRQSRLWCYMLKELCLDMLSMVLLLAEKAAVVAFRLLSTADRFTSDFSQLGVIVFTLWLLLQWKQRLVDIVVELERKEKVGTVSSLRKTPLIYAMQQSPCQSLLVIRTAGGASLCAAYKSGCIYLLTDVAAAMVSSETGAAYLMPVVQCMLCTHDTSYKNQIVRTWECLNPVACYASSLTLQF